MHAAIRRLAGKSPSPRVDAEMLFCHVLHCSTVRLRLDSEQPLDRATWQRIDHLVARRLAGEPVAYLIGERGFWTLDLSVDPRALIPRPETELLVDRALHRVPRPSARVADLGTGTGAIALALASERPGWQITGIERDPDTLALARRNSIRLQFSVDWREGDWLKPLAGERMDLIVSNPPYIADGDRHLEQGDLRFEPRHALVSGPDGLDALRIIIRDAPRHLRPGGWLLLEHGYDQQAAVQELMRRERFRDITSHKDLGDQPRVTEGRIA
ncbi:peptide chain release factor N(5)-glutamine methyltransferase [Methylonatrum kenyense]|uniref:peptide chain release factor N(5)-glutamine methyltransferase n=1 Tax=Methylonatrum kenyense TaxID=455253 RepID=UPI0024A79E1E|nr:peptide chain release factor N(5)-glutamine methyltransferase [Methylonatrum kenyense]